MTRPGPNDGAGCMGWQEDLSALLDGELGAPREAALREHLDGCARCRERLTALSAVDARLAELPAPALPADLRARLQARLEDRTPPGERAPAPRRRWLPSPRSRAWLALATAAAAVALVLAVGSDEAARSTDPGAAPTLAQQDPPAEAAIAPHAPPVQPAERAADPRPATLADPEAALEAEPPADLALALELETVEDLEVIANLELLQVLVALEEGTG